MCGNHDGLDVVLSPDCHANPVDRSQPDMKRVFSAEPASRPLADKFLGCERREGVGEFV